ncbi:MAG: rhodanese-like domain-containing protein [Acidobacteria bacterium]|jgi:rhodanese-related sulfurtransferase|nr:rhodanese-like domain-containing protein [Acidobacteriota bacterium]
MGKSLGQCVVLALAGMIAGLSFNAVSPKKLPLVPPKDQTAQGFRMVTSDEVKYYIHEEKGTVVVDARSHEEFSLGHIPGAVNIPEDDFDASFAKVKASLENAKTIIIYCSGGSCSTSEMVAEMLRDKGRLPAGRLWIYTDGFPGWMRGKNKIESGMQP